MKYKTVTYEFKDGSKKNYRLTEQEMEYVYCVVMPSLDPVVGEVIYAR